jgi:hypothetical protein
MLINNKLFFLSLRAFILNAPLNVIYGSVLGLTGLLLYAYVVTIGCDPFQAGLIQNKNQARFVTFSFQPVNTIFNFFSTHVA